MRLDGWLILVAFALVVASTAFAQSKYHVIVSTAAAFGLAALLVRYIV